MSDVALDVEPDIIQIVDGPAVIRLVVLLNLSEVMRLSDVLRDGVRIQLETAQ